MTDATPVVPPRRLSLRRNIGYAMIGKIYYAATQFLIIALTARLGTQSDVGALTLASAIVTPLYFLTGMGMQTVLTVDDLNRYSRADYVGLRFIGGFLALSLSVLGALIFYADQGWLVLAAVTGQALVRFFGAQASLNQAMFQRAERQDYVAASIFVRTTAGLIGFVVTFWLTHDLPMALFCEAALWFASYWMVDTRLLRQLDMEIPLAILKQTSLRRVWSLLIWVMPMGVALWLVRLAGSVPPIMLEHYAGLDAVGLFGALAYANTLLSMVANAMGGAASARLRRQAREGRMGSFRKLTVKMVLVALAMGLGALALTWLIGEPVLTLVFGAKYADGNLFLLIVAASSLSLIASPLVTAVTAMQAFRLRVLTATFSFSAGVVAALLWVPSLGAYGGGLAFLATSAAQLLANFIAYRWLLARRGSV